MNKHLESKISIIIPIYNADNYLKNTFNCLSSQTVFDSLEIILVNDGSTDKSLEICEKYANENSNVVLISQKNMGVSSARNTGIRYATSEYVTFLDADDTIENDLYEKELELINCQKADIIVFDFKKRFTNSKLVKYRSKIFKVQLVEQNAIMKKFFSGVIGNQVVDKLFTKKIIDEVSFSPQYKIGEDMLFVYDSLKIAKKVIIDTSIDGYIYEIREDSAMTGAFSKKFFDPVIICNCIYEDCKKRNFLVDESKAHLIHECCKTLEYIYRHNVHNEYKKEVKELRKILLKYPIVKANRYLIKKQFAGFLLMRYSPSLYLFVHKFMKIG